MFNFSGSEIVFLLILGLVVLGPEKLPGVLRRAGRLYGEFKRVTSDAQTEMRRAFAEPIRDIQQTVATYKSEFEAGTKSVVDDLKSDPVEQSSSPALGESSGTGTAATDGAAGSGPDTERAS